MVLGERRGFPAGSPSGRESIADLVLHTLPGRALVVGAGVRVLASLAQLVVGPSSLVDAVGAVGTLILLAGLGYFTWRLIVAGEAPAAVARPPEADPVVHLRRAGPGASHHRLLRALRAAAVQHGQLVRRANAAPEPRGPGAVPRAHVGDRTGPCRIGRRVEGPRHAQAGQPPVAVPRRLAGRAARCPHLRVRVAEYGGAGPAADPHRRRALAAPGTAGRSPALGGVQRVFRRDGLLGRSSRRARGGSRAAARGDEDREHARERRPDTPVRARRRLPRRARPALRGRAGHPRQRTGGPAPSRGDGHRAPRDFRDERRERRDSDARARDHGTARDDRDLPWWTVPADVGGVHRLHRLEHRPYRHRRAVVRHARTRDLRSALALEGHRDGHDLRPDPRADDRGRRAAVPAHSVRGAGDGPRARADRSRRRCTSCSSEPNA